MRIASGWHLAGPLGTITGKTYAAGEWALFVGGTDVARCKEALSLVEGIAALAGLMALSRITGPHICSRADVIRSSPKECVASFVSFTALIICVVLCSSAVGVVCLLYFLDRVAEEIHGFNVNLQ